MHGVHLGRQYSISRRVTSSVSGPGCASRRSMRTEGRPRLRLALRLSRSDAKRFRFGERAISLCGPGTIPPTARLRITHLRGTLAMQKKDADWIIDHRLFLDDSPVRFIETNHMGRVIQPVLLIMHNSQTPDVDAIVRSFTAEGSLYAAHLIIARDGSITQFVPFNRGAWHAGNGNWGSLTGLNNRSIGIEL